MEDQKQSVVTLKNMLLAVKGVKSVEWDVACALQQGILLFTIKVTRKCWFDAYKEKYDALELDKIETWRSIIEHREFKFEFKNDVLLCHATIHESMWSGRVAPKFEAELVVPDEFLVHIESEIRNAFSKELDRQHEDHLDMQRRQWKQARADEMIGKNGYRVGTWE